MRKFYSKMLALVGLITLCGGGSALAQNEKTVGRSIDYENNPSATEYVITGVENAITVEEINGSQETGDCNIELKYKEQNFKGKIGVNSYKNKAGGKQIAARSEDCYVGFTMEVAPGYTFTMSKINASLAFWGDDFHYQIAVYKGDDTTPLDESEVKVVERYGKEDLDEDYNGECSKVLEEGIYKVKLYYWTSKSSKYILPLNISVTGSLVKKSTAKDDATLTGITVNGNPVAGFDAATTTYSYELPYGTTDMPEVVGTPNATNAVCSVTYPESLPGAAVITVTAEDGTTKKDYTVNLTVKDKNPDASATVKVNDIDATLSGTTYSVNLNGYEGDTAPVVITPADKATVKVGEETGEAGKAFNTTVVPGGSLSFSVTAEDGTLVEYTLNTIHEKVVTAYKVWNLAKAPQNECDGLYHNSSSTQDEPTDKKLGLSGLKIGSGFSAHFNIPAGTTGVLYLKFGPREFTKTLILDVNGTKSEKIGEFTEVPFTISNEETTTITITRPSGNEGILSYVIWAPDTYTLNLNSEGYLTYSNASNNVEINGATAYAATIDYTEKVITCSKVGTVIPKETGVLLYGEPNAEVTVKTTTAEAEVATNDLVATNNGLAVPTDGTVYVLNGKTFKKFIGTELPANKAYFISSDPTAKFSVVFDDNSTTGINEIKDAGLDGNAPVYNIAGQRVSKNTKGILIQNGKKFVNK